jgi:hypothetical protein
VLGLVVADEHRRSVWKLIGIINKAEELQTAGDQIASSSSSSSSSSPRAKAPSRRTADKPETR